MTTGENREYKLNEQFRWNVVAETSCFSIAYFYPKITVVNMLFKRLGS